MAAGRLGRVADHLEGGSAAGMRVGRRAPDDVLVVAAIRTPIGKAKRGSFKDTTPDVLLRTVLKEVVSRGGVPVDDIGDIQVGNVWHPGAGADMSRFAQLCAGLPYRIPLTAVNRQCSSGLQAVFNAAAAIKAGVYDAAIGAGVESMSTNPHVPPSVDWGAVSESEVAMEAATPMGMTSETVAERYGVSRRKQDEYAAESQRRASQAQKRGLFDDEIVPVVLDDGTQVRSDDGIRADTTVEGLSKLRPAFKPDGSTTAGNSSQISDGAAAALLCRRDYLEAMPAHSRPRPLGVFRAFAVVGVKPDEMGVGPAVAIPVALKKAGITIEQVDVFEINEAFASQFAYSVEKLGIDPRRVNPLGGAIALGHPLGMTGCRQIATLLHHMRRIGARYGVISMCIGTGMGAAAVFENEEGIQGVPPGTM